jgi:hypothetical protein
MINLSVKTRLEFKKAFDRALKYFILENSLILVELVAHLHGEEGATELRISGEKITGKEEYKSMDILMDYVEHMVGNYGFRVIYFLIHIHGPGEDPIGHLMITVQNKKPTEINLQGQELDYQINDFADSLPKA